jgi:hypothetical protein
MQLVPNRSERVICCPTTTLRHRCSQPSIRKSDGSAGNSRLGRLKLELSFLCFLSIGSAAAGDLHDAVLEEDMGAVEQLLAQGADANARSGNGLTALHYAAVMGQGTTVETLLAHGADVNAKDNLDVTPLFFAAQEGHEGVVELLVNHGAEVNVQHTHGATPLHAAALGGYSEMARRLIRAGADASIVNNSAETPLMVAVTDGQREAAFAICDSLDGCDKHVAAEAVRLSYQDLAGALRGGNVSEGRIWSSTEPTITPVSFPIGGDASQGADTMSLSGTWTMGELLFSGAAEVQGGGLDLMGNSVVFFTPAASAPATAEAMVDGYRVQIYAAGSEESARKLKALALGEFKQDGVAIYIEREGALFKLRIGDLSTRQDADRLRAIARRKGFADAWIVKSRVRAGP